MPDKPRIGFIGLGIMGRPMALNLRKAGYGLTVWNRSRPGIEALVAAGAAEAGNPREVAEISDVVITIVSYAEDVEQVALGPGGIIEGAHEGLVHIDMSTIGPEPVRRIGGRLAQAGVAMLDAPVSGGERGAIEGTLSIMAGGEEAVFERCRPVLESMGKKIVLCGPSGSGQVVKLCNQVVVGLNNLAVCEALVLCTKLGVDAGRMLEAVGAGGASSWIVQNLAPRMLQRDFRAGFKVEHQSKDLRYALDAAHAEHASLPGTALVRELFAAVEADGLGGEGTQALVKALEKLSGVTVGG
ncbi:MAG TPA: NAD(P)-dependent oxidoreductase [Dehalococcoidia bacterium]|nr:NAD(P)-dependent oxidoreductase [Dehalococcoidia bacterium]